MPYPKTAMADLRPILTSACITESGEMSAGMPGRIGGKLNSFRDRPINDIVHLSDRPKNQTTKKWLTIEVHPCPFGPQPHVEDGAQAVLLSSVRSWQPQAFQAQWAK